MSKPFLAGILFAIMWVIGAAYSVQANYTHLMPHMQNNQVALNSVTAIR